MPIGDSVVIEGNAADGLRHLLARLSDHSALIPKLGEAAMDAQKQKIEQGRDVSGAPFADLAESTILARGPGHPYGSRPLLDTTAMYQSIHFEERGPSEVFAGPSLVDAPYFPFVNQGAPRRGIPERTFIGLAGEDEDRLLDVVYEWAGAILA